MSLKSESLPTIEQVKQRIAFHEAEQKRIEQKLQEDRGSRQVKKLRGIAA